MEVYIMRKNWKRMICILAVWTIALSGCGWEISKEGALPDTYGNRETEVSGETEEMFTLEDLPEFQGTLWIELNGNQPNFAKAEYTTQPFEKYSPLDSLGRCGVAYANICKEIMPTEERGPIGAIKPSGWHTVKYDCVDGNYLYNRCHLIGYQLSGENANEKNLITGTRYFNIEGMLPFEEAVADFVKATEYHVLYRVTPVFEGNDLVAKGVAMEAASVEDKGEGLSFSVFVYNVQPQISIDYTDGESWKSDQQVSIEKGKKSYQKETEKQEKAEVYILNTNTMKYHRADCAYVSEIQEDNRYEYEGSEEQIEAMGYVGCKRCIKE